MKRAPQNHKPNKMIIRRLIDMINSIWIKRNIIRHRILKNNDSVKCRMLNMTRKKEKLGKRTWKDIPSKRYITYESKVLDRNMVKIAYSIRDYYVDYYV